MSELKIVFFGDVVGKPGRKALAEYLPEIKKQFQPDLIIANIENAAHGKGITENTLRPLVEIGVGAFTSGEHIYDKADNSTADKLFDTFPTLLRPANFEVQGPGRGDCVVDTPKGKVLVISLIGQVFFRYKNSSPWEALPEILSLHKDKKLAGIIIDFHAEATSEKIALWRHFDGQVSAILGSHTHVPTADAEISKRGTAFVSDVGMNGPADSVLGMKSEVSIERFLSGKYVPYDIAESSEVRLNYIELTLDAQTGRATKIEHKHQKVNIENNE